MSNDIPIIGRDALLSLVDWVTTIRRQQDERTLSGESGIEENDPGGTQASHHDAVSANGSPAVDNEPLNTNGGCGKDGA